MSPKSQHKISLWSQVTLLTGLVALWCLLWGQFTSLSIVTGIVLAIIVSLVFYLPAIDLSGRINVWYAFTFFVRLVIDIVRASLEVAWLVVNPRYSPSSAILAIPLDTRSDLIMTWTAEAISLVPGSIVVDVDRASSVLYVHVIDVHSDDDLERFRDEVLATERRLVMAIGSKADVWRVRQPNELTRATRKENDEWQ